MLLAGDELGRTQGGNNNAYCQDNETSWLDWELGAEDRELLGFVRRLVKFRREHIAFHRHRFFRGHPVPPGVKDITWLRSDGGERERADWEDPERRTLAFVLSGDAMGYHLTHVGEPEVDDTFLVMMNGQPRAVQFELPADRFGRVWRRVLSTDPAGETGEIVKAGERHSVRDRTLELFVLDDPSPS